MFGLEMISTLIREIFIYRKKSLTRLATNFATSQETLLDTIISKNKSVSYLSNLAIKNSRQFKQNCHTVVYDDIESIIIDIKDNNKNELTTEKIIAFAKSSGTTSRSKLIPMTKHSLEANFTAGKNLLANYLSSYPASQLVNGKNFSLTGSYHIENGHLIGDVSALFTYFLKPWYRPFRVPNKEIATIADWEEKLKLMTPILANSPISWIAGVPSWMSIVIDSIENYTQRPIHEVWKNLEVFFYGGVSIEPFRTYFNAKFEGKLNLWQTYNASEGFFGIQTNKESSSLDFIYNTDNYYEFIAKSEIDSENPIVLSSHELIIGNTYELVITNSSGLYRYRIGDLIQITNIAPIQFEIVGRTKNYINIFGEELMVHNTEIAISKLCKEYKINSFEYTVAPIVEGHTGYHKWLIEMPIIPLNITELAYKLDAYLREINSDYDAKRFNNMILKPLQIQILPIGSFNKWLEVNQRINVQSKIPKLVNNTSIQNSILSILNL